MFKLDLLKLTPQQLFSSKESDLLLQVLQEKKEEEVKFFLEGLITEYSLYAENDESYLLISKSSKEKESIQLTTFSKKDDKPNGDILANRKNLHPIIERLISTSYSNKSLKFKIL